MIVLGIETSARWSGVALAGEEGVIGAFELQHGGRTEHLHRLMTALFADAGVVHANIAGVAVSTGPGSFTGLRIGLGAAKGFCLASGAPIVGVPLLPLLVARAGPWNGTVAAWIDAGRGEVYGAFHHGAAAGRPSPGTAPFERFLEEAANGDEVLFVGSGAVRYREEIENRLGDAALFLDGCGNEPSAADVALAGRHRLLSGEQDDLDDLEPIYLRHADAKLPAPPAGRGTG